MATYYNITATIAFDQIEADSPQEAAAKAYAEISHKPAPATPERVLVWEKSPTPAGGVTFASTAWTFAAKPQSIQPPAPLPQPKPLDRPENGLAAASCAG